MPNRKLIGIAAFLLAVFVAVPVLIAVSGRWGFYYLLTSVALLSIGSAGVWLTFYFGHINIGQGAYALMGGYVSAVLITKAGFSFWATLPLAGVFCAVISFAIGLPILLWRIVNSRLGHLCRSLQQNEELASSIGVNTAYVRVLAYAI